MDAKRPEVRRAQTDSPITPGSLFPSTYGSAALEKPCLQAPDSCGVEPTHVRVMLCSRWAPHYCKLETGVTFPLFLRLQFGGRLNPKLISRTMTANILAGVFSVGNTLPCSCNVAVINLVYIMLQTRLCWWMRKEDAGAPQREHFHMSAASLTQSISLISPIPTSSSIDRTVLKSIS